MNERFDWIIHYVSNSVCNCWKADSAFKQYLCNAHTHGLGQYDHPEFQVVIDAGPKEIARLLNTMGIWVREGKKFCAGNMVSVLYEDCQVLLYPVIEDNRELLRLVIPDAKNRFPQDPNCTYPYCMQLFPTSRLYEKT